MNPRYSRYYTFIKPVLNNKLVKSYSFVVFSLLTSALLGIFAIQPTVRTIVDLVRTIQAEEETLKQVETKVDNLGKGKANYDKLDSDTKLKLESLIPNSPNLPTLISGLSQLAKQNEATISGLQFQPADVPIKPARLSKDASLSTVDFTLNLQGEYPRLVQFLTSLSKFNHLVNIESVNFNRPTDNALVLSINGKAYFLRN